MAMKLQEKIRARQNSYKQSSTASEDALLSRRTLSASPSGAPSSLYLATSMSFAEFVR